MPGKLAGNFVCEGVCPKRAQVSRGRTGHGTGGRSNERSNPRFRAVSLVAGASDTCRPWCTESPPVYKDDRAGGKHRPALAACACVSRRVAQQNRRAAALFADGRPLRLRSPLSPFFGSWSLPGEPSLHPPRPPSAPGPAFRLTSVKLSTRSLDSWGDPPPGGCHAFPQSVGVGGRGFGGVVRKNETPEKKPGSFVGGFWRRTVTTWVACEDTPRPVDIRYNFREIQRNSKEVADFGVRK